MKNLILSSTLTLIFSIPALAQIDRDFCVQDSDCVPAACCDNSQAVNQKFAPDCSELNCTTECKTPYDCGCSEILCVQNRCTVRIKEPSPALPFCSRN